MNSRGELNHQARKYSWFVYQETKEHRISLKCKV